MTDELSSKIVRLTLDKDSWMLERLLKKADEEQKRGIVKRVLATVDILGYLKESGEYDVNAITEWAYAQKTVDLIRKYVPEFNPLKPYQAENERISN